MPTHDLPVPYDWLTKAEEDMRAAELLLAHGGPLGTVALLIHQATEKCLKGYLLSTGWRLERVHDLETLLGKASARAGDFAPFLAACQRISEYYIEGRYPTSLSSALTHDEVATSLEDARRLAALVRKKVATPDGRRGSTRSS